MKFRIIKVQISEDILYNKSLTLRVISIHIEGRNNNVLHSSNIIGHAKCKIYTASLDPLVLF